MEEYFGEDLEGIMDALEENDEEIMQFINGEVDEVFLFYYFNVFSHMWIFTNLQCIIE